MKWMGFVIIAVFAVAHGFDFPVVLYSTDAVDQDGEKILPADTIFEPIEVSTGDDKIYILLCDGQIAEISRRSLFRIDPQNRILEVFYGTLTLHSSDKDTFCYGILSDSSVVRYASSGKIVVYLNDSAVVMAQGDVIPAPGYVPPSPDWFEVSARDGKYLFELLEDGKIPARQFDFRFPSRRGKFFRHYARGHSGYARYRGEDFYYGGLIYQVKLGKLKFVYDFWIAYSFETGFYSQAWDEWRDLIDHIKYIELFERNDPVFLRVGLIENVRYGKGLLMNGYNNALFLPFEKSNGVEFYLNLEKFSGKILVNDISYPALFGVFGKYKFSEDVRVYVYYVGDFDILRDVHDSDGDGYPDEYDPQPDSFNTKYDSVIVAAAPPFIWDYTGAHQIHGFGVGGGYTFFRRGNFAVGISGEFAAMTTPGVGVSLPNLSVNTIPVGLGVGAEFQSPKFIAGVFDGTYESRKVRFVQDTSGRWQIRTVVEDITSQKGWLYGWNYRVRIGLPDRVCLRVRFRDVYRDAVRDENFYVSFEGHKICDFVPDAFVFVSQKNVAELFRRKTDGEMWGSQVTIVPHRAVRLKLRYREQYDDRNSDGVIRGDEIHRNFSGSVILDGTYWWHRFLEWIRGDRDEGNNSVNSSP